MATNGTYGKNNQSDYDIAIIGGGPAGLSAAMTLVRQSHTILLFDDSRYRNSKSKWMHTLPTWDHRDPVEFRAVAHKDLATYNTTTYSAERVVSIKKIPGPGKPPTSQLDVPNEAFRVTTTSGKAVVVRKVILANGVDDSYPDIDGYADCWVKGIYHCLVCKGWEERGAQSSGILAIGEASTAPVAIHFSRQALRHSAHVTIYTHGNTTLAESITAELAKAPCPVSVESRGIQRFEMIAPDGSDLNVYLEDGTVRAERFLTHKPSSRSRGHAFTDHLDLEFDAKGNIKVNPPFNQTSVRGVFAAGGGGRRHEPASSRSLGTAVAYTIKLASFGLGISPRLDSNPHRKLLYSM